jgi:ubiquinone/menaquinone biosynthesis C-methylase UbiE
LSAASLEVVGARNEAAVRRPTFIARQSGKPTGALGRIIAWIMSRETAELNEQAVALLSLQPTDRVLEIGFGHGRTIERIGELVPDGHAAGIDVSESMTQLAIRRNRSAVADGRADLRTGDCAALPFDDCDFASALSVHTIYFWNDAPRCLREIHRVLRPGARFVLGFTVKNSSRASSFPTDVYTFYDEAEIRTMLSSAGFEVADVTRHGDARLAVCYCAKQ